MASPANFEDWLAICNVKADYCRLLDTKDWDGWKQLFTEDLELDTTPSGGTLEHGRDRAVDVVRSSIETAKTAHQVHFPKMEIDGDTAHVIWPMEDRVVWEEAGRALTGYGHYHEVYRRQDGQWRIAKSRLTRLTLDFTGG